MEGKIDTEGRERKIERKLKDMEGKSVMEGRIDTKGREGNIELGGRESVNILYQWKLWMKDWADN